MCPVYITRWMGHTRLNITCWIHSRRHNVFILRGCKVICYNVLHEKRPFFCSKMNFLELRETSGLQTEQDDLAHVSVGPLAKLQINRLSSYKVIAFPVAQKSAFFGHFCRFLPIFCHVCPCKSLKPSILETGFSRPRRVFVRSFTWANHIMIIFNIDSKRLFLDDSAKTGRRICDMKTDSESAQHFTSI